MKNPPFTREDFFCLRLYLSLSLIARVNDYAEQIKNNAPV